MIVRERVPLAPLTTFGVGGEARFFIEAHTEEDVTDAIAFARDRGLPLCILGAGSNVLVSDEGIDSVVLHMKLGGVTLQEADDDVLLVAGAGVPWDDIIDAACAESAWGIENLAGIPGTMGGATVQNIGAYGTELQETFEYADVIDSATGGSRRIMHPEAAFGYRTSLFKEDRKLIVVRTALRLKKEVQPNIAYADLVRARDAGVPLATPADIVRAIRAIRAEKFPHPGEEGTAGSFFKNPVISHGHADELVRRFSDLPAFPQEDGVKVSLAWLLDHALSLRGYAKGLVRLYEKQPLVVVARTGATAADVHALATDVSARVLADLGIAIEHEVEYVGDIEHRA